MAGAFKADIRVTLHNNHIQFLPLIHESESLGKELQDESFLKILCASSPSSKVWDPKVDCSNVVQNWMLFQETKMLLS